MSTQEQLLQRSIEHLHGPEEIPYGEDELVVVCLVRDGRPYIKSFVEHYFSLGAKHIVFLDNNSTDGTVEALKNYENVTVLRTKLSYKAGPEGTEILFKQYLIDRFGKRGRWCLCVDIDELFDYPYSDVIGLSSFLGYLNSKSYTAVVAQMLDMFPEEPLTGRTNRVDEPLKERHRFYDVSNIRKSSIKQNGRARRDNNTLESDEIDTFRGGIRKTAFGFNPVLTKHPLVFLNGRVKPMNGSSHRVGNARVADLTCVLFHYKFIDQHFREQVAQAVHEEHYARNSAAYKKYLEALDRTPILQIKREDAKELGGVNELLESGFLVVSEDYVSWVNLEEENSALGTAALQGSEPSGPAVEFIRSRRQERAKTLKIQWLERQIYHERMRLTQETRQNQRLMRRVRNLEQQLESIQASQTWKLAKVLHRIKDRILRLGRSVS